MLLNLTPTDLVIVFVVLVISITLHEMMHAYAGLKLGDTTAHEHGRISLNPLSHIDPFATILLPIITLSLFGVPLLAAKPVPFNPANLKWDEFGAAIVAIAGPLTNLALALVGTGLVHLFEPSAAVYNAFIIFIAVNVGLFVFNMLPIPPLDGSRVLYSVAPEPLQRIMSQLEIIGIFIVFGLVLAVPAFGQLLVDLNTSVLNFLL